MSTKYYLRKRSNGVYYIGYINAGRKRWKSTRCTSKKDALGFLNTFQSSNVTTSTVILLTQFISEFLDYARSIYSPGTVSIYQSALRRIYELIGDVPLLHINSRHLDRFKAERLKEIKPVTVNIELRTLKTAFNTGKRWRLIEHNPFDEIKLLKIDTPFPCYFSKSDLHGIINTIREPWLKDITIFAVSTGMRRGEILNLKWDDIDWEYRSVNIRSSPTYKVKMGKSRIVPLNDNAWALIQSLKENSTSEYVFTLNGKKIFPGWVQAKFKQYIRQFGLNEKLHFHSLRHTFASWLVQDGVSLYEVQKLLGHSNISVTQVYAHLQPERLHSTVNRISIALN